MNKKKQHNVVLPNSGVGTFPMFAYQLYLVALQSIASNRLAPIGQLAVNSNQVNRPVKAIGQSAVLRAASILEVGILAKAL